MNEQLLASSSSNDRGWVMGVPLVPAKCTNCGSNLDVDSEKDAAICPSCGSAFVIEKAINNYNTTNVTKHEITDSVVNINYSTSDFVISGGVLYEYTGNATTVVVPDGVIELAAGWWNDDDCIKAIIFPASVVAVNGIPRSVDSIRVEGSDPGLRIVDGVLYTSDMQTLTRGSCKDLSGELVIPDSVITIGENAFHWCTGLTGPLTIPGSVTTIGDNAFENCGGLTGPLAISDSVTSIGYRAFANCQGLTGPLIIPDSVTTIGDYAFANCQGLTGPLIIPDSVTAIGEQAFEGCEGLTGSVTVPDSVTFIGEGALAGLGKMDYAVIPEMHRLSGHGLKCRTVFASTAEYEKVRLKAEDNKLKVLERADKIAKQRAEAAPMQAESRALSEEIKVVRRELDDMPALLFGSGFARRRKLQERLTEIELELSRLEIAVTRCMDKPAAWYRDPQARHELRYWDGWEWTAFVSDRGVQSSDSDQPISVGPDLTKQTSLHGTGCPDNRRVVCRKCGGTFIAPEGAMATACPECGHRYTFSVLRWICD